MKALGIHVTDNAERLFAKVQADVVVHTAGSRLKRVVGTPNLRLRIEWGWPVTDILAFPIEAI
jgi:hypothetical protein